MGVQVHLTVYAPDEDSAVKACRAAFDRFERLDEIMSDWRRGSELNRLSASAGGPAVAVSEELFLVLQRAQEVSRLSNGAFDITVGPVIALWRNARRTGVMPDPVELDTARRLVGWRKVELDPANRSVRLSTPGMKLDLGGIAKGYAADCAIQVLKEQGISSALVEAGGDVVVSEPPPGTPGWIIEVTNDNPRLRSRKIFVKNAGISTSGDAAQFVVIDGKRYSHIVDPRTGIGLINSAQVTIVAKDGLTSDPLSTAVSVMGEQTGRMLAKQYKAKAYVLEGWE
jgi:FAD:protein FMN transferase